MIGIVAGCGDLLGVSDLQDRADAGAMDASDASDPDVFDGCALTLATNPCALFPQCGCTNQNCVALPPPSPSGTTECLVAGTTPLYTLCNGNTCEIGAACIGGVCKPLCATDDDCPRLDGGGPRICAQITTTGLPNGKPVPGLKTCSAGCDFLQPGALCGPNVGCVPIFDTHDNGVPDCIGPAGKGMGPGACVDKAQTDCAVGYACTDQTGPNPLACSKYCRILHQAEDCGSLACVPFAPAIVVEGVEFGSCN